MAQWLLLPTISLSQIGKEIVSGMTLYLQCTTRYCTIILSRNNPYITHLLVTLSVQLFMRANDIVTFISKQTGLTPILHIFHHPVQILTPTHVLSINMSQVAARLLTEMNAIKENRRIQWVVGSTQEWLYKLIPNGFHILGLLPGSWKFFPVKGESCTNFRLLKKW